METEGKVIKCRAAVAWEPGKPVSIEEVTKECERCLSPKTNFCAKNWVQTQQCLLADGTSRFTCRNQQVYQLLGISTFSEYTVVPEDNVTKIHPDAPLDKVCLLGCGVSTGYGAALNTGKVEAGSTCAVFGLGTVGLAAIMGCKASEAKRIIAVDINPNKFEIAKTFGATEFVNPKDHSKPIQEVLKEMTNGGVDFSIECVGNVAVMRNAVEACTPAGGICVMVGWTRNGELTLVSEDILLGKTLKGSYLGGWKSADGVSKLVQEYMNGRLLLDEFVTHRLTLDQVNEAFDLMVNGKSIRSVLKM